jgi:hypothetical protein
LLGERLLLAAGHKHQDADEQQAEHVMTSHSLSIWYNVVSRYN